MKRIILLVSMILCVTVQVRASYVNVAIGASVTASHSSASGSVPTNIVDGSYTTFSQIRGTNTVGSWQLDLGLVQRVDQIVFWGIGYNSANGINYTISSYDVFYKENLNDTWIQIVDFDGAVQNDPGSYADVHTLASSVEGQYFLLDINYSYWNDPLMLELELNQSDQQTTIPEPASIMGVIIGLSSLLFKKQLYR